MRSHRHLQTLSTVAAALAVWIGFCCNAGRTWAAEGPIRGTLRVHPENSRFLTDDGRRAVYLAGHQWFNDLQHNAWNVPTEVDWDAYLEFMADRGMNYLRSWTIWSVGCPNAQSPAPLMPFPRTGPGVALDGRPRFDLTKFDPAFFDRLRRQVAAAEEQGLYVSIMLFEVYGFMDRDGHYPNSLWGGNVLHGPNNVNGIDVDQNGDRQGLEFFYSSDARITHLQQAYVKRVIDAVNEFDNVFYEIANELEARDWQYRMIRFVRQYESTKPKQHLTYMSPGGRNRKGAWSRLPRSAVAGSPADLYAVTRGWTEAYRRDPPVESSGKPVIMDMDHVAVDNDGDNDWNNHPSTPWKLFTRGYHQCIYDDDYWRSSDNREAWERTRRNVGLTAKLAAEIDLAKMSPQNKLATSQFCLANPGREYVVFCPAGQATTVESLLPGEEYRFRWIEIASAQIGRAQFFRASADRRQFDPRESDFALHLVKVGPNQR